MSTLLVAYDLNRPGQNYPKILNIIETYPYARLSESAYAITTSESLKSVFEKLNLVTDPNDNLTVVQLSEGYWWSKHSQPVIDWLLQFLN